MTEQPSMAHLEVTHPGPEFDVLQQQALLQARIYKSMERPFQPISRTEAEFLECFRFNVEADGNENAEILDRLPWKEWKADHRQRVADGTPLTEDDRLEIKYELVDKLHFLLNMMIRAGFTSWHEVESFYYAKNKENFSRQDGGY